MIDFRSDTFTKPTAAMRSAMASAEVGDDVYGEDPTVNDLEAFSADLLGFPAAMFAPTGTQSNLCAIMAHCGRGDEYIVGQQAHTYLYEAGGAAVLGSIQPQPVAMAADGRFDLDDVAGRIKVGPSMNHFAHSKLLCLENTHNGRVLPTGYVTEAQELARSRGLAVHLDGARLWNAAVASGVSPAEIASGFDSVSVCLSKGLGAPVGSVLVGDVELIAGARRWRKMLGGGMRQAGILAAGGRHAIENQLDRLADDHANAAKLAEGLAQLRGIKVDGPHTNMVFITFDEADPEAIGQHLSDKGIRFGEGKTARLICHLGISSEDVELTIDAFRAAL